MNPTYFWKRYLYRSHKIIIKCSLALAVSICIFLVTILNDQLTAGKDDDSHRNSNIDVKECKYLFNVKICSRLLILLNRSNPQWVNPHDGRPAIMVLKGFSR